MARLNNRPSTLTGASPTPGPTNSSSDQENRDPQSQRRDKGKGRATDDDRSRISLPTPSTDGGETARGKKRKRPLMASIGEDETTEVDEEATRFNRYFDPNQDPEIRRQVKRKSRAIERDFLDNRDQLLNDNGEALRETINRANGIFQNVKQTNDATVDSRLFVNLSDLAYKRAQQLVLGDKSAGIDADDFLSKCITFMKNGPPEGYDGPPTQTQRRGTQRAADDDDDDDDDVVGEPLDFELLGRHICFPYNSRPTCPSFLLGPLSVEKKQRKQTQRTARQTKDTYAKESRPEAISRADLAQSDENALTAICGRINNHMRKHCKEQHKLMKNRFSSVEDLAGPIAQDWFKEHRIRPEGGPYLFDYVLNPDSFGQTVENIFYVSFLIKENKFGLGADDQGLPILMPTEAAETTAEKRKQGLSRHQAILALDYETWLDLIKAFEVTEPMIPHRQDDQAPQIGQNGWYT